MTRTTAEFPIQYDVDLAPYNTLNIEAKAASFLSVTSQEQLISFIKEAGQEFDAWRAAEDRVEY